MTKKEKKQIRNEIRRYVVERSQIFGKLNIPSDPHFEESIEEVVDYTYKEMDIDNSTLDLELACSIVLEIAHEYIVLFYANTIGYVNPAISGHSYEEYRKINLERLRKEFKH